MVLWRPIRPFRTNTQKRCPFHYRGLECKSRKSRNTWSNRKIWPWTTEWSRAKTNRVLPRKCTGHNKHPLPTHKRRLYTWTSPDGQHQNQTDYILCSQRRRSSIQSAKTRPGADCGSDHELFIAKSIWCQISYVATPVACHLRSAIKPRENTSETLLYPLLMIP